MARVPPEGKRGVWKTRKKLTADRRIDERGSELGTSPGGWGGLRRPEFSSSESVGGIRRADWA